MKLLLLLLIAFQSALPAGLCVCRMTQVTVSILSQKEHCCDDGDDCKAPVPEEEEDCDCPDTQPVTSTVPVSIDFTPVVSDFEPLRVFQLPLNSRRLFVPHVIHPPPPVPLFVGHCALVI